MNIRLRPIRADELEILHAPAQDPEFSTNTWFGFRSIAHLAREYGENGFLGDDVGRLMIDVDGETAGFVSYLRGHYGIRGDYYDVGIALLPAYRGRGIGWRAQALNTAYVFEHMPVQRVQAGTQASNVAEQKSLLKAGFQKEGVVRSAEFRAGKWQDCVLFSRLRDDPYPELDS